MIFNMVVSGSGSGSGDLPWQTFVGNPLEFNAPKAHTLQSVTVGFEPIQDTSGGDPSPSNICPISGWTGCNVTRVGKNLFDIAERSKNQTTVTGAASSGYTLTNDVLSISKDLSYYGRVMLSAMRMKSGTYTLSFTVSKSGSGKIFYSVRDMGSKEDIIGVTGTTTASITRTFTVTSDASIAISIQPENSAVGTISITDIQIELGSTATAYEPYQGETVTVDWTTEAGTVYGGTIDVATGLLTVEKTSQTITGNDLNLAQNIRPEGNMWRLTLATSRPSLTSSYSDALCNSYKVVRSYSAVNNTNNSVALNNSAMEQILVRNDSFTTRQEIIDGLNASPIQLVYELATPQTYQLTAQQVQAIAGRNVMWTDCASLTVQARGTNV